MLDSFYPMTLKLLWNHVFLREHAKILPHITLHFYSHHYLKLPKSVNHHYSIKFVTKNGLKPLSNEQRSIFKSWNSRAVWKWVLIWKCLKRAPICLSEIHGKHCSPDWSLCRRFSFAKTWRALWRRYDVRKFNADAILFSENQCKKNGILKVLHVTAFSVDFWLESG